MNREIKFRAWDGFRKRMITKSVYEYASFDGDGSINCFNPFGKTVLMQCTGWKDKNGKKVYEGDICEYDGALYSICWSDTLCGFYQQPISKNWYKFLQNQYMDRCEIKGNIYENPELLNGI